jgi:two-component system OmpR family sensor kinase
VKSIRRALLVPLALGLALAIVAAAVGTYLFARVEANALFDVQLQQMAASITGMPLAAPPTALSGGDGDGTLVVQVWNRDGVRVYQSKDEAEAPAQAAPGFATVAGRDGPWRVFSVLAKGQLVQVGQPMRVRNELAAQMALRTTLPLLIAAPLIALLVWFAIRRGLLPLDQLAGAVGRRGEHELASVPTSGWPREVEPLVDALNGLLARLQAALGAQRAFVADAAHALRTPLAAVHLQAQIAERATGETERASALEALKAGLDRATRLSSQLLTLAREEHVDPQRGFARSISPPRYATSSASSHRWRPRRTSTSACRIQSHSPFPRMLPRSKPC